MHGERYIQKYYSKGLSIILKQLKRSKCAYLFNGVFCTHQYFFNSTCLMKSDQNQKNEPSQQHDPPSEEDYFEIIKNYGRNRDNKDSPESTTPNVEIIKPTSKKQKKPKPTNSKKKTIKKEQKPAKKYSPSSQQKREIAGRHKDRLQKEAESDAQLALWKRLMRPQIIEFLNVGDYQAAQLLGDLSQQEQGLEQFKPEERREMVVNEEQKEAPQEIRQRAVVPQEAKQDEGRRAAMLHQQLLFHHYLNYQSPIYDREQQSQDFFFDDIGRIDPD